MSMSSNVSICFRGKKIKENNTHAQRSETYSPRFQYKYFGNDFAHAPSLVSMKRKRSFSCLSVMVWVERVALEEYVDLIDILSKMVTNVWWNDINIKVRITLVVHNQK